MTSINRNWENGNKIKKKTYFRLVFSFFTVLIDGMVPIVAVEDNDEVDSVEFRKLLDIVGVCTIGAGADNDDKMVGSFNVIL